MAGCTGIVKKVFENLAIVKNGLEEVSLEEAAEGCRSAGFEPQQCAPCLYLHYPETTANEMAVAVVHIWAGEVSTTVLQEALTDCVTADKQRAYTDQDISQAVSANLSLEWLDDDRIEQDINIKVIGLYHGDLTNLKPAEKVDFLVVSALPGDYSPTAGSLIGALNNKGVSVATLAQHKAADYEPELPCWISQPITSTQPGIAFDRVLLYEPANPAQQSAQHIEDIFTALTRFVGNNTTQTTVAMPLVSTGSGGADPTAIMTAIFNSANQTMATEFLLYCLKIAVFEASQVGSMTTLFEQLKNQ